MSARDIVGGLAGAAVGAVKHPIGTAEEAISKAKSAVGAGTAVGTAVAGTVVRRVRGGADEAKAKTAEATGKAATATGKAADAAKEAAQDPAGAAKDTVGAAKDTAVKAAGTAKKAAKKAPAQKTADQKTGNQKPGDQKAAAKKAPAKKTAKKAAKKREPQVVMAEPTLPIEPPIDVVGQALAAEAEEHIGAGRTTEPRGASRDEEHGAAALQRAEAEEIAEETVEVTEAGNLDVDTPVHTTGADVGFNPDTAEADLQQPGTEPLLDPSLTKAVKAEQDVLHQAAEPDKG